VARLNADLKKMPFFCRLETEILLRALDLRLFLIGRSAIRNPAAAGKPVVGFRWQVMGLICPKLPLELLLVATVLMAQNTNRMIAYE